MYELLRESSFAVLDLSGVGALRGLTFEDLPATVVEAHPVRRPDTLADVTALIVRPDTYISWATTSKHVDRRQVRDELTRALTGIHL